MADDSSLDSLPLRKKKNAPGMATPEKPADAYSAAFAFIYIFNLIVGVGALSLPKVFSDAGVILGTILLVVLAFMSYVASTYMVEAMAAANAYVRHLMRKKQGVVKAQTPGIQIPQDYVIVSHGGNTTDFAYSSVESDHSGISKRSQSPRPGTQSEKTPLIQPVISEDDYEIDRKFEMGAIANMFYHPVGIILYYIVICLYLFGDLAIYIVAISKSLVVVVCNKPHNTSDVNNSNISDISVFRPHKICFQEIDQIKAYYIFLAIAIALLSPWTFFNLTRSKYLQFFTTVLRNIAFVIMIIIAVVKLCQGETTIPNLARIQGFPSLFGVSVYSFMCQHSLPGMITPMKSKRRVFSLIFSDFVLILLFYLLMIYTGAFHFNHLEDLYTLNFLISFSTSVPAAEQLLAVLGYFLALFPVFTLSTNFPIISITLRENLKALAVFVFKPLRGDKPFHWSINRFIFPLLALIPPIAIAFGTYRVDLLVSITGSYPGIGVQYVIPATLALAGKYVITKKMGLKYENRYKSPFSYVVFFVVIFLWTIVSIGLIITENVFEITKKE